MNALTIVLSAYARAWQARVPMLGAYLAVQLVTLAVLAPAAGIIGNLAVSLSGKSALTDADIAKFFLTPVGAAAILAALGFIVVVATLGFALMTLVIHDRDASVGSALISGLQRLAVRFPTLFLYAVLLLVRLIAVSAPFVIAGLIVFKTYLTAFDINYYLSNRPPEALLPALVLAVLGVGMVIVLTNRLLTWALSLHAVLFGETGPQGAFRASARRMEGQRLGLLIHALVWLGIRVALGSALTVLAGLMFRTLPLGSDALQLVLVAAIVMVALWALAGIILSAMSNGALAYLLYDRFDPVPATSTGRRAELGWLAGGVVIAALVGILVGALLLDRVKTTDTVQIIAHRGASGARPENTMASIRQAVEDGADWVEIDVQETADGEVIVVHDSDFMKLASVDLKVWDATMEDLAGIDIGSWYGPDYATERTPLLSEALTAVQGRSGLLIELKYYGHDVDLEHRVIDIVEAAGMQDSIATMSLKLPAVEKMKALRPDWRSGALAATAIGDLAGLDVDFVAVNSGIVSQSLINRIHASGKEIYVWTVNDPLDMSSLMGRGVDGLITDEPALARRVLAFRADLNPVEKFLLMLADLTGLRLNANDYRDNSP